MSDAKKGTLGEILSASQIISADDIANALEEQKRTGARFGEALINLGIVTQEDIDWALSNQLDIPYIRLKKEMIDPDAITLVPAGLARAYNCIPLIKAGGELNVALADPLNRVAIEALESATGCVVNVSVALIREIREMIVACYGEDYQDSMGFVSSAFSEKALEIINTDLNGGKLLDYLLLFMMQNRISSIALQPLGNIIQLRAKKGSITHTIGTLLPNHYPEFVTRLRKGANILPSVAASQSGILTSSRHGAEVSFRVLTLQGEGGEYVTLHQNKAFTIPSTLERLNLSPTQQSAFQQLVGAARGITLFASRNQQERNRLIDLMLEESATGNKNVIILGSGPGRMSKRFPRILMPDGERERAHLIRDALDHSPDVLVLEDVTDPLPFIAACRAAMRGVLVLAGIDHNGLIPTLRQLHLWYQKQMFLPVFVNGVISFKGIELLCPHCRTLYAPPQEELAVMRLETLPESYYRSQGCEKCNQSGVSERRIAMDILPFDSVFLDIFEAARDQGAVELSLQEIGYCGSEQEGKELLQQGLVSPDEYIAAILL